MPFVKFSRDKRGYANVFLIQPGAGRRGKSRSNILYWFRTPPHVRIGRGPFDDPAIRALQAQNPGIAFDWAKLRDTVIPAAPPVDWRERRLARRAARQARDAEEVGSTPTSATELQPDGAVDIVGPAPAPAETPPSNEMDRSQRPRRRRRRRGRRGRRSPVESVPGSDSSSAPPASPLTPACKD
jgi:hypothetical protein